MLVINSEGESGTPPGAMSYARGRGILGKLILPLTRWLRAVNAERYMKPGQRHLDIGCGDGYFLRRSASEERFGLDAMMGDEVTDTLDFEDSSFDCVTMLAVIEHLSNPRRIVEEVARVLKPGGRFVITTPKRASRWLLRLYARDVDDEHERYFDLEAIEELSRELLDITGHHLFLFGLNQAFCLTKSADSE